MKGQLAGLQAAAYQELMTRTGGGNPPQAYHRSPLEPLLAEPSGSTCYVYGYPGQAFFNAGGFPVATGLTRVKAPHAKVIPHPGGNAQAMLTWRVNVSAATP